MRKQELIHLHGLLMEVARYYKQGDSFSIDLSEYESLETDPSSIHRNKAEHQAAVFALIEAITDDLHDKQTAVASANAD